MFLHSAHNASAWFFVVTEGTVPFWRIGSEEEDGSLGNEGKFVTLGLGSGDLGEEVEGSLGLGLGVCCCCCCCCCF